MLNLFFPKSCKNCLREIETRFLCLKCETELLKNFSVKFIDPKNHLDGLYYFIDLNYLVRKILHLGKYRFNKIVWQFFGKAINENFKNRNYTITYVPMNWIRFCFRGFNQSFLLANFIGNPIKLVSKNWMVHSVTNLNKKERAKELEKAFLYKKNSYKNILIVDDVYTTGATLNQIAKVIKQNNPSTKVYGLVIAKTPLKWRGS